MVSQHILCLFFLKQLLAKSHAQVVFGATFSGCDEDNWMRALTDLNLHFVGRF